MSDPEAPTQLHAAQGPPEPTAAAALRPDEARRYRAYFWALGGLILVTPCALPYTGAGPRGSLIFLVATAAAVFSCALLIWRLRDTNSYQPRWQLFAYSLPQNLAGPIVAYYLGVFSPAVGCSFLAGVFVSGMSASPFHVFLAYTYAAALMGVEMMAVTFGALPDVGLVRVAGSSRPALIVVAVGYQAVLLLTLLIARYVRRSTLSALTELEKATRATIANEALLAEAHQALEKALGEGDGRWSGQRAGRWTLGRLLGRGGMGEVYDARDASGRNAAVKMLLLDPDAGDETLQRFQREAEILTTMDSRHVVRVFELGDAGGRPFIAMERLDGSSLAAILRARRRLPLHETLELVEQAAQAIEAARAVGVVHRDLKPANLFWVEEARLWKVLDFGISKIAGSRGTLTQGSPIGTPGYMAPEQAAGKDVDHRADVFALAAVAYRALTGVPPFAAEDPAATLFSVLFRQPTRPSDLADMPSDVELVLARGLAKEPSLRFETARELAKSLTDATTSKLSPRVRADALALLAAQPWGGVAVLA